MKKKIASQIYRSTCRSLKASRVDFSVKGSGPYMFVSYSGDCRTATVHRFKTLGEMKASYEAYLDDGRTHLQIAYIYLELADLLFDHERTIDATIETFRMSFSRNNYDELFSNAS